MKFLISMVKIATYLTYINSTGSMIAERQARHYKSVIIIEELWHFVKTARASVFVHAIQSLDDSMPRCITALIAAGDDCSRH